MEMTHYPENMVSLKHNNGTHASSTNASSHLNHLMSFITATGIIPGPMPVPIWSEDVVSTTSSALSGCSPLFLQHIFQVQPSLAQQRNLLPFNQSKTRDQWMYPFQALLTHDNPEISLLLAALAGYPAVMQERTEQEQWTPLHIAAKFNSSFPVFQLLLDREPNLLCVKDQSNMLPMYYLVYRSLTEPTEMRNLLHHILSTYPTALGQGQNSLFTFAFYVGAPSNIISLLSDVTKTSSHLKSLDICNQGPQASYKTLVGDARPATAESLLAATGAVKQVKRLIFAYRVVEDTRASIAFFRALEAARCVNLEAFYFVPPSDCDAAVIAAIAAFCKSLPNLKKLWISGVGGWSHLPAACSDELLTAIGKSTANTPLEEVLIQKFRIRRSGLGCFFDGDKKSIKTMTVDQCAFSQEAAEEFGASLAKADQLFKLNMEGLEGTSNESLDAIIAGLGASSTIKELKIECKIHEGSHRSNSSASENEVMQRQEHQRRLDPKIWGKLTSLETVSLFFSKADDEVPHNESPAFCALVGASQNLRKITSHYGNFDNADLARVIQNHQGLRALDIDMHDEAEITSSLEPDTGMFNDFSEIVDALKVNRLITSIGQAHSKHWRDATFFVVRNWLGLHRVGKDNLTLSKFVDVLNDCRDHIWEGEVDNSEDADQLTLSLYYQCLRNTPHLWSQDVASSQRRSAKRRKLVDDR